MEGFYGKALIIDNDMKFVDELKRDEKLLASYPAIFSKTIPEATSILKQDKFHVRVVFLSHRMGRTHGLDELKAIKAHRPQLPVILIVHNPESVPQEIHAPEIGFTKLLIKPRIYRSFVNEIDQLFSKKEIWTDVKATEEAKDVELNLQDSGYIPTHLSDYILTPKSFFNVYIKIGQAKFIKILNAGDTMTDDLISNYAKKGITHLYISAEEQKKYISLCEELSKKIMSKGTVDLDDKVKSVLTLGANVSQYLMHTGITQDKVDYATTFLNQSVSLMRSIKMQHVALKSFLESIEMKEHASSVSFLAGIIANEVGFESTKSVKLVGLAALIHDIGLYDLDPTFTDENAVMNDPQKQEIFNKHPRHGASLLQANGGFDEVVIQAVEQHHLRRRGSDSARRVNNINLVTEIIGVADELQNLLITPDFTTAKLEEFKTNSLPNFSPQIEKAVVKLIDKKQK